MTNIIILLVCLVILFCLSYVACGKDFFAPATMLSLTFMFSTLCAIYKYRTWKYDFSGWTTFVIVSSLAITLVINSLVVLYGPKYLIKKRLNFSENISPITFPMTILAIIVIVITIAAQISQIFRVGGISGTLQSIMSSYRMNSSYSTDLEYQTPQWIKNLLYFTNAFSYLFSFELIYFWKELSIGKKICDFLVIVLCLLSSLLTGGRFGTAVLLVAIVLMYHLIQIKKRGFYKQYKLSSILKILIAVMAAFFLFYVVRNVIGRNDDNGLLDYVTHYFGGGIPALDIYFKKAESEPVVWGQETFYSLINNLRKLGILDISYYYVHREFSYSNGVSLGNVYTAFRDYYHDFGMIGMYVLHAIYSLFFSVQYQRMKEHGNLLKIIAFSTTYYSVALYSFSNSLFAKVISIGFLIQLMVIILLYEILLRKKVVFKVNG